MAQQSEQIDYDPLIVEDICELGSEYTRPAGCAVCWAGCLPKEHRGLYANEWGWMYNAHVLVDEAMLCNSGDDQNWQQLCRLNLLPRPLRVGQHRATFTSQAPAERHTDDRHISRLPALLWYKDYFILPAAGLAAGPEDSLSAEELEEPTVDVYNHGGEYQPLFYLPVHDACLSILDRFMAGDVHSRTLAHFSEAILSLCHQWSPGSQSGAEYDIHEYGAIFKFMNMVFNARILSSDL